MLGNQLKKPAQKRELALAAVGMVALCFFAYTNFYKTQKINVDVLEQSLKESEDKVLSLEKLNQVLKEKRRQMLAEAQSAQSTEIPDLNNQDIRLQMIQRFKKQKYQGIADFFKDVASPGFRGAVTIDSIKHDPIMPAPGYKQTKFSFQVRGEYTQLVNFLRKLEGVSALVAYDTIVLNADKDKLDNVSLVLSGTFYQLEDENA